MNIVYISYLINNKTQGPYYSVPSQIKAQSEFDNVFWYNLSQDHCKDWSNTNCFNSILDFTDCKISKLPAPFNKPDLVIFESYYNVKFLKIGYELLKRKIPYIIIPRGAFTKGAQNKKKVKKKIGNAIGFKYLAKKALAIQYLTKQEKLDSGIKWNSESIVIANGVTEKISIKKTFNSFNGCYIGRFDLYHKGLDILIDACEMIQSNFRNSGCSITLYGPERLGQKKTIEDIISNKGLNDIIKLGDGVYGMEKENALLSSDFFIMTSRFEGHPTGLIEAMSYGLPCLVTTGTNMKDEVDEHDAGWTADTTVDGVKDSLLRMLNDFDKFEEKGFNALELSKKYNWGFLAKKSHDAYKELLSKK